MDLIQAGESLREAMSKEYWFVSVGIAEEENKLYLYVRNKNKARKRLDKPLLHWHGYSLIIKQVILPRPLRGGMGGSCFIQGISMNSLPEILALIEVHHKNNPDHGLDCACLDKYICQIRKMTTVKDPKAQRRIDYVLRSACEHRY